MTGISIQANICQILGEDSQNSLFSKKNLQKGFLWSGGRPTKFQTTTRPEYVCRSLNKIGQPAQNREQTRMGKRKAEAR